MTPTFDSLPDDELSPWVARAVALQDAPPAWVHAAIGLWATGAPQPSMLRRIVALLSFDSAAAGGPLALGVRGAAQPGARQLLYTAGERDIDLRLSTTGGRHALAGQVLGPDSQGSVALHRAGDEDGAAPALAETPLDAFGEFRLEGLADGRYVLVLTLADERIVLPALDLGAVPRGD